MLLSIEVQVATWARAPPDARMPIGVGGVGAAYNTFLVLSMTDSAGPLMLDSSALHGRAACAAAVKPKPFLSQEPSL